MGGEIISTHILKKGTKMKNKFKLIIIIVSLFQIKCFADMSLEKIVEYPTSGVYLEKDNLCVRDNYLFAASSYGLEIYEIEQDEQAQLISRLPLRDDARTVAVKDNYAYVQAVSYYENHTNLYKIDISDVNNTYIADSVYTKNEDGFGQGDIYNDFIIFRNHDLNNNFYYSIYKIPGFEFVQNYYCSNHFIQLNDSLALYRYNGSVFTLYDFSNPENITEIGQVDLTAGGISIDDIQSINDTILACIDFEGIAFWNISNSRSWQYISTIYSPANEDWSGKIYTSGDFIFISYFSPTHGIKSIDISDIFNPYAVDSMPLSPCWLSMGSPIVGASNSAFIGTYQKIHQFILNNGYFEEQFDIIENYLQYGGVIYNNYLYVSFVFGLKIYDISSLPDIYHIDTMYEDHQVSALQVIDNLIFFIDYTDYAIIVLDLSNPTAPIVRNEIDIPTSNGNILLTDDNYCLFYKEDSPNNKLYKYSIPEPNDFTLDFQYNLNCNGNGFIYNDHFYYLAGNNPNGPDLQIYGGIEDNNPELIMIIEDFAEGYMDYPNAFIKNVEDIFCLGSWEDQIDSLRFFGIENPTEINYIFSTPNRCDRLFLFDNNYMYMGSTFSHIYIYNIENVSGMIEPIADYSDYGFSQYCIINESDGNKYLYHFQGTGFSIYEIHGYGVDDEIEENSNYVASYPNPFSTSTTISFSEKLNLHEFSQLKIYNIKGQLIRELKIQNLRLKINEAIWDGHDENGNEVSTGVYFYKTNNNNEHIGKVVKFK